MLLIKRRENESVFVDESSIHVLDIGPQSVMLGFTAPRSVKILRAEIVTGEDDLIPLEDRKNSSYLARLRSMPEARRQRIIEAIVREFCGPKKTVAQ